MDPNEALANLREAVAALNNSETAIKVIDAFEALDTSLANGGDLPDSWDEGRRPTDIHILTVKASYGMDQTYHLTEEGAMNTYRETCALDPEGEGLSAPRLPKSLKREMLLP